jgi:hypothetical protein
MTRLAQEIAAELRRGQRRRRLLLLLLLAAAVVALVMVLHFGAGPGLGLGPSGDPGSGAAAAAPAPRRCALRLDATGLTVDGKPAERAAAIATCATAGGADVVVTGSARQGAWDELRQGLAQAGVPAFVRGRAAPAAP